MPPFTYERYQNPFVGDIAALIQRPAQAQAQGIQQAAAAQAQGQLASGQAWGGAAQQIGQNVSGVLQQAADPRRQLEQEQLKTLQEQKQYTAIVNQISASARKPDGTLNSDLFSQQMAKANIPLSMQAEMLKSVEGLEDHATKVKAARMEGQAAVGNLVYRAVNALPKEAPPDSQIGVALNAAGLAKSYGLASDDDIQQVIQSIQQGVPIKGLALGLMQQSPSKRYEDVLKPLIAPRPGAAISRPGEAPEIPVPVEPKSPTETEVALKAAGGDPVAAMKLLKPDAKPTAEQDNQKYLGIQQKVALKQPLTPEEQAFATAFEKLKTVGPEASAAAAADRQTVAIQAAANQQARAIAAQTAQQGRAQSFAEAQAGRTELTNKIEQPYLDSREKADVLRSVVAAAQHGNMEAASVQSLLGTLGLVTAEGVKRINGLELQQVSGAGSLWERIKGQASKLTSGQPLPPKLQNDLVELAGVLDQSGYAKYERGFEAVTKRYGLKDEQKLPGPLISVTDPLGGVHQFKTQADADAFRKLAGIK